MFPEAMASLISNVLIDFSEAYCQCFLHKINMLSVLLRVPSSLLIPETQIPTATHSRLTNFPSLPPLVVSLFFSFLGFPSFLSSSLIASPNISVGALCPLLPLWLHHCLTVAKIFTEGQLLSADISCLSYMRAEYVAGSIGQHFDYYRPKKNVV